jgi:antitoxin ParD1/3/4
MTKNTSISLGSHFESFIHAQITSGRYGNTSEVVRAGLRLLEEHEQKLAELRSPTSNRDTKGDAGLRRSLADGAASGDAGELDFAAIRRTARKGAAARRRRDKARRQ